jgi:hypothetical protein
LILSDLLAQIISTCKIPHPPSPVNRKVPETVEFPGLLTVLIFRSALAELRSAAGGFETVLLKVSGSKILYLSRF